MRTREEKYGIGKDEAESLRKYCQSASIEEQAIILRYSYESNKQIYPDIFYSLVNGLSYDKLMKARYIPMNRNDFYGYQRKCLTMFREYLASKHKWE